MQENVVVKKNGDSSAKIHAFQYVKHWYRFVCTFLKVWNTIMNGVEWNKKEELVAEQALKHLKQYSPLLAALTTNPRSELALLLKVQEYCYENMNFLKAFQKINVLFYKSKCSEEN